MSSTVKNILKFLLFFSVGILIFWLVYRKQDWGEIWETLLKADFTWIWISLIMGLLSHISRAARWQILISPLGYKTKFWNSFFSVMIMYISNMLIPRSGEVVRCGVMNRTEKVPFTKLLGTVVIERVIDFIMLFILLAIVLFTQFHVLRDLVESNPDLEAKLDSIVSSTPFVIGIFMFFIVIIILIYVFRERIKKTKLYDKLKNIIAGIWEGIKTIIKMERKFEFIAHSVFIWAMYFLMIYIVFWSFEFTEHLTILTGLTVFVMSAFGMVFPSPGGVGSWHFAVIITLMVYGIENSDANAFALASHGSMTLMMILVGVVSIIFLPVVNKGKIKIFSKVEEK